MSTGKTRRLLAVAFAWLLLVAVYVINLVSGENIWPGARTELELVLKLVAIVFVPVTGFLLRPKFFQEDSLEHIEEVMSETDSRK